MDQTFRIPNPRNLDTFDFHLNDEISPSKIIQKEEEISNMERYKKTDWYRIRVETKTSGKRLGYLTCYASQDDDGARSFLKIVPHNENDQLIGTYWKIGKAKKYISEEKFTDDIKIEDDEFLLFPYTHYNHKNGSAKTFQYLLADKELKSFIPFISNVNNNGPARMPIVFKLKTHDEIPERDSTDSSVFTDTEANKIISGTQDDLKIRILGNPSFVSIRSNEPCKMIDNFDKKEHLKLFINNKRILSTYNEGNDNIDPNLRFIFENPIDHRDVFYVNTDSRLPGDTIAENPLLRDSYYELLDSTIQTVFQNSISSKPFNWTILLILCACVVILFILIIRN